jgi:membrane-bound serine protease (ClpP class)
MRKTGYAIFIIIILIFIAIAIPQPPIHEEHCNSTGSKNILILNVTGSINYGQTAYISSRLEKTNNLTTAAVIIVLNAGTGILKDAFSIDNSINITENKGIPVYVYIPPHLCASHAGTYIALNADGIYFAANSQIGEAKPYIIGTHSMITGYRSLDLGMARSMAARHGYNLEIVSDMIINNSKLSGAQAVSDHLGNGTASSLNMLIQKLNLSKYGKIQDNEGNLNAFSGFISDPVTAGMLILIGIVLIFFDLNYGTIFITAIGLVLIILGIIGSGLTGISFYAIILFAASGILMFLQYEKGNGLYLIFSMISGIAAIYFMPSSYGIYNPGYSPYPFGVNFYAFSVAVFIGGVLSILFVDRIMKSQKLKIYTGPESLLGKVGVVISDINKGSKGTVLLEGVRWNALNIGEKIPAGGKAAIVGRRGVTLIIKPYCESH